MRSRSQLHEHAAGTLDRLAARPERQLVESPPLAGGGAAVLWAKIEWVGQNSVTAKFADAEGNVDPEAEAFDVHLYASDAEGVMWLPELLIADCNPKLVVGQYIQIVQMSACGPGRPAGWWLVAPPLSRMCDEGQADFGEPEAVAWLRDNLPRLRALLEEQ